MEIAFAIWLLAVLVLAALLATAGRVALMHHLSRRKDQRAKKKERTAESIWGPLGHFTVFNHDEDDVWSIEGVLTDDANMQTFSGTFLTREQAVEHARVCAGIAPFGPEETKPVPATDRRGLVAHSRAQP